MNEILLLYYYCICICITVDKVKLRKQISSGVSSMNSSAENLPGSGYLQLDRILDGGGVNSGNHGNDSCNEVIHSRLTSLFSKFTF